MTQYRRHFLSPDWGCLSPRSPTIQHRLREERSLLPDFARVCCCWERDRACLSVWRKGHFNLCSRSLHVPFESIDSRPAAGLPKGDTVTGNESHTLKLDMDQDRTELHLLLKPVHCSRPWKTKMVLKEGWSVICQLHIYHLHTMSVIQHRGDGENDMATYHTAAKHGTTLWIHRTMKPPHFPPVHKHTPDTTLHTVQKGVYACYLMVQGQILSQIL